MAHGRQKVKLITKSLSWGWEIEIHNGNVVVTTAANVLESPLFNNLSPYLRRDLQNSVCFKIKNLRVP